MATIILKLEKRIDAELADALSLYSKDIVSHVKSLINGGNKFRAKLFYNASKSLSYNDEACLITVSSALEILHRASLIHDDLADKSSTRRGVQTLHDKYGDTVAIYVPNILRDYTEKMLTDYPVVQEKLMEVYNEICRGQLYEAQISRLNKTTWEDYEKIVELKSSGFGRFALEIADYLTHGKADEDTPRAIAKTGAILFQIVDDLEDLLDTSQDISIDIQNGIKPAPYYFLTQEQKEKQSSMEDLQRVLSQPDVLKRTYEFAKKHLSKLENQFRNWLPGNRYRKAIIDDISIRFRERKEELEKLVKDSGENQHGRI